MYFPKHALIKTVGVMAALHVVSGNQGQGPPSQVVECVLQRIESLMIEDTTNTTEEEDVASTVCILDSKYDEDGIAGIAYEFDESTLPYGLLNHDVESSETMVTISAASIDKKGKGKHGGGKISIHPGATIKKEKKQKKQKKNGAKGGMGGGQLRGNTSRRLSQKIGDSSLIVLYVIPPDAVNNDRTSIQLANDIFGINTTEPIDAVNVRSQISACSKGQLNYIPACGTQEQACYTGTNPIVNGVLEVPISESVTGISSGTVVNYATSEAQVILNGTGVDIYSFEQIMVVIPDEASWGGAAAWAYVPGQLSAFRDSYSWRVGVQMHEFGHNLGLGHSGKDGAGYADYSCMMGSPSYGDDGPEICWNGAKSWESGWYSADSTTLVPSEVGASFELIGVADWVEDDYTSGQHKVVVEIPDSSQVQNYYVIYNRAKGPNNGVNFAKDQVTITLGSPRSTSWHQAMLGTPDLAANEFAVFRKPNYNGGDKDLVVKVCAIDTGSDGGLPDVANVLVYTDDGPGYNNGEMCPGEVGCLSDAQCDDGNYCTRNTCVMNTCVIEDISAENCPSCGDLTFCNPAGYCDVLCNDMKTCTLDSCVAEQCQHDPIPGCAVHGAQLEYWYNIGGSAVADLTGNAAFEKAADEVSIIQGSLNTGTYHADNYGSRLTTYIQPKVTGNYNFYIASDDASELWLSTDDNPANKAKIAWVTWWTSPESYTQTSSQKSDSIFLEAGQSYYLETLHKEGGGGDHLAVAWESVDASVALATITGSDTFFVEIPVPCTLDQECDFSMNPCETGICKLDGFCEYSLIEGCQNGGLLQTWTGIGGNSVSLLLADPRYPDSPTQTRILSDRLEVPDESQESFGSRLQTYLKPPVTCDYVFYIASDDEGTLNLSNSTDPANAKTIAYHNGWTSSRQWNKYSSQKSAPIRLEKGELLYLEALYKEGGGGDTLAVGWECLEHGMALDVIDAKHTVVFDVTSRPTSGPSQSPSKSPSVSPTTAMPTTTPSKSPSNNPTVSPTLSPSGSPTPPPSVSPSTSPTTAMPSSSPSKAPTNGPTTAPTISPSLEPTSKPTQCAGFDPNTCGCDIVNQADYRGTTSVTESGLTCQRWDSQLPHSHVRTPESYPYSGLDDNYCRNPDGESKAWCYTTDPDVRWAYCAVASCVPTCIPDTDNCGCASVKQADYRGTVAVTVSGHTCQTWNSQFPHAHDLTPDIYPNFGLDSNYCRNPNGEAGAWCFTTDDPNKTWELCDVTTCATT